MDVRCPQCETLYELDSSQIKSKVVTLKCSQCQHVFRFESRTTVVQENQRRWMVRNLKSGDIHYLNSFEILHKWIMEGKVTRRDEISRTGKKWTLLGDIGEFMPVFQVVDSISTIAGDNVPAAEAAVPVEKDLPPSPHAEPERERVSTTIQYGGESAEEVTKRARPERPQAPTPAPPRTSEPTPAPEATTEESSAPIVPEPEEPAQLGADPSEWEIGDGRLEQPSEPMEVPGAGRSLWPIVLVLLLVAAGGGYAYVATYQPEMLSDVLEEKPDREVVSIGNSDAGADADADTDDVDVNQLVAAAYEAAFRAQREQEVGLFDSTIEALRPGMDQALGVATEESEAWAEGGAVDELLVQARRALESGRQARALSIYEEVLSHDNTNVIAITGIGWAYVEQSRSADAVTQFKRALDLNSGYGDAYIGLGTAERQRGNLKAAYDAYDLYLGRHPKGEKASIARYQMDQLRQQLGL